VRDKLSAARKELGTTSVKRLMDATGASRSNVRTWLRNDGEEVKLGRPTFFSAEEEDVIATYMAAWTKGGDLLTFDLASVLLRQYIADVEDVFSHHPFPTCIAPYCTRNTPRPNLRLAFISFRHIVSPHRKTATAR